MEQSKAMNRNDKGKQSKVKQSTEEVRISEVQQGKAMGCGCGAVGRAAASIARDLWFKSQNRQ